MTPWSTVYLPAKPVLANYEFVISFQTSKEGSKKTFGVQSGQNQLSSQDHARLESLKSNKYDL